MTSDFNPWDPAQMVNEPPVFTDLIEEARAAMAKEGARPAEIRARFRHAVATGAAHLDDPPTLHEVAAQLDAIAPVPEYDDGPFEEVALTSGLPPERPTPPRRVDVERARPRRSRPGIPPLPTRRPPPLRRADREA